MLFLLFKSVAVQHLEIEASGSPENLCATVVWLLLTELKELETAKGEKGN